MHLLTFSERPTSNAESAQCGRRFQLQLRAIIGPAEGSQRIPLQ
jgi:hypothetical protein